MTAEASELFDQMLTTQLGFGSKVLDEALLAVGLTKKVKREGNGKEGRTYNGHLLALLQSSGLQMLVVDSGLKVVSDFFAAAIA